MLINQYPSNLIELKILNNYINNGGLLKIEELTSYFDLHNRRVFKPVTGIGDLADRDEVGSLKINKVNIKDVINYEIDITDFKSNEGQITNDSHLPSDVFGEHETNLVPINRVAFRTPWDDTKDKFYTFTALTGLLDLDIYYVDLIEGDKKLTITIKDEHKVYYGSLDIKTW